MIYIWRKHQDRIIYLEWYFKINLISKTSYFNINIKFANGIKELDFLSFQYLFKTIIII